MAPPILEAAAEVFHDHPYALRDSFLEDHEVTAYFLPRPQRGRPEKDIPLNELERACRLMPTDEDLARMFDVDVRTIERKKKNKAFLEAMERGKAQARESLRRAQFRTALSGGRSAATMLIWLGKQVLGQKDRIQNEHTGLEGGPIEITDVRSKLANLISRRAERRIADEVPGQTLGPGSVEPALSLGNLGTPEPDSPTG